MKINTAFKLSALAVAVSFSTSTFATVAINGAATNILNAISVSGGSGVTLSGNTTVTGSLTVGTTNVLTAIDAGDVTTLASANSYADAGDVTTLASANSYADAGDVTTLASANSYADAGDAAITAGIAAGVTTASLTVDGPSQFNGEVNVNAVTNTVTPITPTQQGSTFQVDTLGTPSTTLPIAYTDSYTRGVESSDDSQIYTSEKLEFSSKTVKVEQERQVDKTADANYDANGEFAGVVNVVTTNDTGFVNKGPGQVVAEDSIIVGRENAGDLNALTIRSTTLDANNQPQTTETKVTASGISTDAITLAGQDLATTLADEATARAAADTQLQANIDAEAVTRAAADTQLQANIDAEAATRAAADTQLQANIDAEAATRAAADLTLQANIDAEAATREAADLTLQANIDAEAATREAADLTLQSNIDAGLAAAADDRQAIRDEAAAESVRLDGRVDAVDSKVDAGLTAAATDRQAIRNEAAAESVRLDGRIDTVDTKVDAGLAAAATDRQAIRTEFAAGDAATLASANAYTNTQVANVNSRVNQLNSRVDDVEKTSYRGIAIALAAQQQIPNIGAGQFAVFGGVGHYEGESAGALGIASVFADGRTSVSAAVGFAGGNEVGGRVGVSYVFGGK